MALTIVLQLFLATIISVLAEIEMEFTKYPEPVTAPVGDTVAFDCAVRVPGERLAWRWKPVAEPDSPWREALGAGDNNVSTRLAVEIKEDTPDSHYQCVVWYGAVSLASIPARLSIARMDLRNNSPRRRMITAPVGNIVVLHCKEPLSEPPASLSWWKDTGKGGRRQLDTPNGVLVIHNASEGDSGTYGCTATNDLSGQTLELPETTYLKVQNEYMGVKFLEDEEYVGTIDNDGVLTMPVRPNSALRLWCGAVGNPPPRVVWSKEGENVPRDQSLYIASFTPLDTGVYTCRTDTPHPIHRSWKVTALEPPRWEDSVANVNATEGSSAHIACGTAYGEPPPNIHWMLNAEPLKTGKGIRASGSDLYIERVEKRHAGIVQCFACNDLGCAYDAALLTVVPMQISDQQYQAEASPMHFLSQPSKKHNRKNQRKHKAVLVPPSRPNITRMADDSVMVSWSHANHGLPIQFYKIQYREVLNSTNNQWHTESIDIPPHIHSFEVDNLTPERFYKFRVAAVYSNQDNKSGKASFKFHLKRGGPKGPPAPVLVKAVALSTDSILLNWTWSQDSRSDARDPVIGFYVYYRALSTAGKYDQILASVKDRSKVLSHLAPDTAYELKLQAYTEQAPSDFSSILVAKTHKLLNATSPTESPPDDVKSDNGRSPDALVTAGGALGVAALLGILVVTLLLCRRAKRPPSNKEKGTVPDSGGTNGYIPAKVPITITANPMHAEGGENGVEMSFLHNNNTGTNDDTLPHARKNGPTNRQYV